MLPYFGTLRSLRLRHGCDETPMRRSRFRRRRPFPTGNCGNFPSTGERLSIPTVTAGGTVRFSPSDGETDYTLSNATDIAFRFKIMHRQANRPNVDTGLSYMRIKFVGSDTVWGISKGGPSRLLFWTLRTDQRAPSAFPTAATESAAN